jgi:hypothetical protein
MFIVQWIKLAQTNPSLHALSYLLQIYSRVLLEEFKFTNFFHWSHKVLETFESCGFSNFVVVVTSISNSIVCKHAQNTFGCLNGVQSNNTTCIFLLYKIVIMCINILHDFEEQKVMHLILMTKKVIALNKMFYKITSHKFDNG